MNKLTCSLKKEEILHIIMDEFEKAKADYTSKDNDVAYCAYLRLLQRIPIEIKEELNHESI